MQLIKLRTIKFEVLHSVCIASFGWLSWRGREAESHTDTDPYVLEFHLRYWVCLQLVLYDEPTAGLDPIASTVVEDLIRSVHINGHDARGKPGTIASYVVVTHQHSTIRRAVDR